MYLNNEPTRGRLVDWTRARADAIGILAESGIDVDPEALMGHSIWQLSS